MLTLQQKHLIYSFTSNFLKHYSIKYENVYPVIMCGDTEAKKLISKAIQSVSHILPSTEKITVTQIH